MGNRLLYSREIPAAAIGTARRHVGGRNFDWRLLHKYARPVDELAGCGRDGEALQGKFCLKGIMSAEDERRAVDIGCAGIVVSESRRAPTRRIRGSFDQLAEIVDAVGDKIDVLLDGGVHRGTHVLKALSLGAKAVGLGRFYLFPLARGTTWCRAGPWIDAYGDRTRYEAHGMRFIARLSRANLIFRHSSH